MIDAEKANYKVAWMCRLLAVPRSSFYAWRNKAETATAARRRELGLRACQPRAYKRTTVPGDSR